MSMEEFEEAIECFERIRKGRDETDPSVERKAEVRAGMKLNPKHQSWKKGSKTIKSWGNPVDRETLWKSE